MLLYPKEIKSQFELDKVCERIAALCRSNLSKAHAQDLQPLDHFGQLSRNLQETEEMRLAELSDKAYPVSVLAEALEDLEALDQDEVILELASFQRIRRLARQYQEAKSYFKNEAERFDKILSWVAEPYEKKIAEQIDWVLTPEGEMRSDASPALVRIRKDADARRRELQRVFRSVLQSLKNSGALSEHGESIRGGRRVIAVRAEHKRKIGGIIHDESESGKTTFIEPQATVYLNNAIAELEREEFREIQRILRELGRQTKPYQATLEKYYQLLSWLDFTRAKAKYANQIQASLPNFSKEAKMKLAHAFHPLLFEQNQERDKETVPLNLELSKQKGSQQILVVSGPNAGGKSVCLKTAGLLQLMFQSGLLIPADPNRTEMGFFKQILGDIGDMQSLEDELSTYSARLMRMKHFMEYAGPKSLFLIDEFGSGTDPALGGTVAESILDELRYKQAFGIVTTHYSNLKVYAQDKKGLNNASMAFDEKALKPLYRLETGKPGSSYTFEIAKNIPLPDHVIKRAEKLSNQSNLEFESLLSKVQGDERLLEDQLRAMKIKEQLLEHKISDFESSQKKLEKDLKQNQLGRAEKEAKQLGQFDREMRELLDQLKDEKKRKEIPLAKVEKSLRKVQQRRERNQSVQKQLRKSLHYNEIQGEIEAGSSVKMIDGKQVGEVLEIRKKHALVAFGALKTQVKIDDLILVEKKEKKDGSKVRLERQSESDGSFEKELDLRGKTREEVIELLHKFLNEAIMSKVYQVRIVHGKGTGTLRREVRRILKDYPSASQVRDEDARLGGNGVTVVDFL